jgi:hypothetical protein
MIKVGKLNATTTEQSVVLGAKPNATLIITSDNDVEISINDNTHYQTYKYGEMVPLMDRYDNFQKLYYKTLSGTAQIRYWLG